MLGQKHVHWRSHSHSNRPCFLLCRHLLASYNRSIHFMLVNWVLPTPRQRLHVAKVHVDAQLHYMWIELQLGRVALGLLEYIFEGRLSTCA